MCLPVCVCNVTLNHSVTVIATQPRLILPQSGEEGACVCVCMTDYEILQKDLVCCMLPSLNHKSTAVSSFVVKYKHTVSL